MLAIAAVGSVCACCFGIVHDQITFTISPEYFTRLKFHQFAWANLGWPPRWFVAEIGVLATWWVGLLGGWFIGRAGAARLPPATGWPLVARSVLLVVVLTVAGGCAGAIGGTYVTQRTSLAAWQEIKSALRLADLPSFVIVAYIHYGSYAGALAGVVAGSILAGRAAQRHSPPA